MKIRRFNLRACGRVINWLDVRNNRLNAVLAHLRIKPKACERLSQKGDSNCIIAVYWDHAMTRQWYELLCNQAACLSGVDINEWTL